MRPFWNIHALSWEEKYMYFKFTSREAWHLGQKSLGTKLQTSSGNLVPLNLTWGNSNSLLTTPHVEHLGHFESLWPCSPDFLVTVP